LLPALRREPIKPGLSIIFRNAFFGRDPASLDEPVKGWIDGPLFNKEYILRIAFDRLGNCVTV
jgi:hypothetical protein